MKPVIVVGGGSHAGVLIETLVEQGRQVLGITDVDKTSISRYGIPIIGDDNRILEYNPMEIELVNGIGSTGQTSLRQRIFKNFKNKGYNFASVIHPSAIISRDAAFGEGVQIQAGAIVQRGSTVGNNTIINTRASIDHDCHIGDHVHIAPGVTLSGGVMVESGVHIGTGAVVIQSIVIGTESVIGAGSVVIRNVSSHAKVMGVPAKEV